MRSYVTPDEMDLINSYSRRQLTPDDVYVFTVKLCDNDIDRDNERFTVESLFVLKELFVGKTGIIDHDPTVKNQRARILSCDIEYIDDKGTSIGEPYYQLMARVYLLRNGNTRELINSIENGTVKDVSVGCSVRRSVCSICHNDIHSPLCNHRKGKKYMTKGGKEKLCFVELQEPTDAYEFAFVAEPIALDIKTPIMALDLFCKTWCIDKTVKDDLAFNCHKCEFEMPDGKCMVKCFKENKLPGYKDFGSMGDL